MGEKGFGKTKKNEEERSDLFRSNWKPEDFGKLTVYFHIKCTSNDHLILKFLNGCTQVVHMFYIYLYSLKSRLKQQQQTTVYHSIQC